MSTRELIYWIGRFIHNWNRFWFREVNAKSVGVMRICLASLMLCASIDVLPILSVVVGPEGIHSASAAAMDLGWNRWTWFDAIETMDTVYLVHGATLVVNVLFLLGIKSQLAETA